MKYLACGILPEPELPNSGLPSGPDGEPLDFVIEAGLAIAFSRVAEVAARPLVSELLAYAGMIEALHQRCSVLPMRYGCVFADEGKLRDFLRRRQAPFHARLRQLAGCSEISLRVLPAETSGETSGESSPNNTLPATGAAYLAGRRARYQAQEQHLEQAARLDDETQLAFQGVYRAVLQEEAVAGGRSLVSLHFLVPREQTDLFRAVFLERRQTFSLRLLLTGPWPPYHFANCDEPLREIPGSDSLCRNPLP